MSSSPESLVLSQDNKLVKLSGHFKKEVIKSIAAIIIFIIVYLLLLALSLLLVAFCIWAGFSLILLKPSFYTLIIGLSTIGCGIMVFVFLIKFLFATSKEDNSDSIEILENEEPVLFQTIYKLAEETNTAKPKKIFISSDVNAAVFYNSSFWSMFLPIRKNLKIGLGLVNTLNLSELKAVIAHEFGHFSQRSMKLGSWVYAVNKIIHDMLYNNHGYAKNLDSLAAMSNIAAFFVQVTVKVVQGIQWVLLKMYGIVNKTYMGLSRQMEFHADLIAASTCGSNNIINALQRSEFAELCFTQTLDICNQVWKEKKVINDFYSAHRTIVKNLAHLNGMQLLNGLPIIKEQNESEEGNRINFKNQWASHPTLKERKSHLHIFSLVAEVDTTSAWTLFNNAEKWKKLLTKQFYKTIPSEEIKEQIELQEFEAIFTHQLKQFSYPSIFREFYNNRKLTEFDPRVIIKLPFVKQPFESVFTEEAFNLPKQINYLEQDKLALQAIINKEIDTESFDFDGRKYSSNEAVSIVSQLEAEKETMQNALDILDQTIFRYFYGIAPLAEAEALKNAYTHYFEMRRNADAFADKANNMLTHLAPVYRGETLSLDVINPLVLSLKEEHELSLKQDLQFWNATGAFDTDTEVKSKVEKFAITNYQYFSGTSFIDNELVDLNEIVQCSWNCITNHVFSLFKTITETQAALLEQTSTKVLVN
jgi:Zn-dependent protease with chaperone function